MTPRTDSDALTPKQIDALRFKAFATNAKADCDAYFKAASKYFQDRHYRAMEREAELNASPCLLEALKLADAALSGANMNMTVVERKVRAAIAKAEGRT